MTGPALAALIERSVTALNEGDFPSAGNVVDSFNRDALERHMASYASAMDGVRLPVDEEALTSTHRLAALCEDRSKHVYTAVAKDLMEVIMEQVAKVVEYGSQAAIFARTMDDRAAERDDKAARELRRRLNGEKMSDDAKALERRNEAFQLVNTRRRRDEKRT